MQPVDVPFPKSSSPSDHPGEGQGRLVNVFCEIDGDVPTWRASPGLREFADTGARICRGLYPFGNKLFAAYEDKVLWVTPSGVTMSIPQNLPGAQPVTWAQNNKEPNPDVVVVTDAGPYLVTDIAVTSYPLPDEMPQPNGVAAFEGYFLFTSGDGRVFASGLNDTTIDPLSFTTCQANPDGLVRGVPKGIYYYAFGPASVEIFADAGTSPFPLSRVTALPIGLAGPWAITGFETGWNEALFFIASDGTARRMDGTASAVISNKAFERAIQSVQDKRTIEASVSVVGGNPVVTFSSPDWTWQYNVRTQFPNERRSYGQSRWRATQGVKFAEKWIVGDTQSGKLFELTEAVDDEGGQPLIIDMESGAIKQFPSRIAISRADFDFTTGTAPISGTADAVDPQVSVSWSHDGGGRWSAPVLRSIGRQGRWEGRVSVNRLGISTHHGIRFWLRSSSPVFRSCRGGRVTAEGRA